MLDAVSLSAFLTRVSGGLLKSVMDFKHLTEGALCTFQGLFLNIANVSTALSYVFQLKDLLQVIGHLMTQSL